MGHKDFGNEHAHLVHGNSNDLLTKNTMVQAGLRVNSQSTVFKQPPQEILQIVFRFALPPSLFLDPALYRGPQSPWCQALRLKKALICVCKAWWHAGVDILYADIVLRRVGQMAALVRTLESPDNDFGNSVKAIRAIFYVSDAYVTFAQNTLKRIIDHCPRLKSLAIRTGTERQHLAMAEASYAFRFNRSNFPLTIAHMEWKEISWHDLIPILQSCKGLESLTLRQPHWELWGDDADHMSVSLDYLKFLKCELRFGSVYLVTMSTRWSMPCLQGVTFLSADVGDLVPNIKACETFCNRHGRGLQHLQLRGYTTITATTFQAFHLQPLLNACPALEHFVLSEMVFENVLTLLTLLEHPTLVWMDVWMRLHRLQISRATIETELEIALRGNDTLPSLRNMRVLDWTLKFATELPTFCLPQSFTEPHEYEQYQYPGINIRHTKHFVYRDDSKYIPGFYDPVEVDSDVDSSDDFDPDSFCDEMNGNSSDEDEESLSSVDMDDGEDLVQESEDIYKDTWGRTREEQARQEHWVPDYDTVLAIYVDMFDD